MNKILVSSLVVLLTANVSALDIKVFRGKIVNSTLISGEKNMLVVDAQFKKGDALRLAAEIVESGKNLEAIYFTHGHPDHVLGSEVLHKIFPNAKLLAHPKVLNKIKNQLTKKVKNLPIPEAYTDTSISIDGEKINIIDNLYGDDSTMATALFEPSSRTLIAGDLAFSNNHLWTATTTKESRTLWLSSLDKLSALKPKEVVTGHGPARKKGGKSEIDQTRDYLHAYEKALASSKSPKELMDKMKASYPTYGGIFYLKMGANKLS